jgi:hypothetical protein
MLNQLTRRQVLLSLVTFPIAAAIRAPVTPTVSLTPSVANMSLKDVFPKHVSYTFPVDGPCTEYVWSHGTAHIWFNGRIEHFSIHSEGPGTPQFFHDRQGNKHFVVHPEGLKRILKGKFE